MRVAAVPELRCTLCGCKLATGVGDDLERRLCRDHKNDPRAKRPGPHPVPPAPRAFNQAERALIAKVHAYMPSAQLLDILNTRLVADVGAAAVPFTPAQLQAEVEKLVASSASEGDWASLRKLLARARQSGLLATITLQVVDDFSVVFSLTPAQHMRLRDVIRNAQEDR